jgi:hypothetical protein
VVRSAYAGYFAAACAAAGALIGLLFVAVCLTPDSVFGDDANPGGRALAGSTFTALVNAFFVSLVAIIPQTSLG